MDSFDGPSVSPRCRMNFSGLKGSVIPAKREVLLETVSESLSYTKKRALDETRKQYGQVILL